ncbi:trypsin [Prauserella shujinwangii]|uniref:Trypsin n=1 Tax=Prauserella shujinwangii TaxID=1453103 RepID=A0A2T0LWN1_9PSEU|nr:serine protease [Prauserella shujinwangii]PRX48433.1 trypsin [Prauserella shujinwangii]
MPTKLRRALSAAAVLLAGAVLVPGAAAPQASGTQPFIVGGQEASIADHPYAVYLVDSRGNQFCGGVLVAADAALTAAHCALAVRPAELGVVAGRQHKRGTDGVEVGVRRVWTSPDYQDPTSGHDIAVLNLDDYVPYRPAHVARPEDRALYAAGTRATVLGWGRTSDGGPKAQSLRSAQVPLTSDATCAEAYRSYDPRTMVCAGFPEGGVDACQGDSGGPLMVGDVLVGIVSWGEGCAAPGKPGVYTRVANYTDDVSRHVRR